MKRILKENESPPLSSLQENLRFLKMFIFMAALRKKGSGLCKYIV
jgi:hypothetical protein